MNNKSKRQALNDEVIPLPKHKDFIRDLRKALHTMDVYPHLV